MYRVDPMFLEAPAGYPVYQLALWMAGRVPATALHSGRVTASYLHRYLPSCPEAAVSLLHP